MSYQIKRTYGAGLHYWYYDIINDNGIEINTRPYFKTYDAAKLAAEAEVFNINNPMVA